jgi:CheY-like chemotaxis protein
MAALAELGHLPVACDHPSKAAKLLMSHRDIGLIISDVLMPDMTGPEMIRTLPAAYAHVPVLFVTGYAGDIAETADFAGHEVLRKPYTLAGLAHALSNALSGSHHSGTAAAAE